MPEPVYMGIDLGSVSLNAAVVDTAGRVKHTVYRRTQGRPLAVLLNCLKTLADRFETVFGIVVTGSGRKLVGSLLEAPDVNEIVTQARAACHFHPEVRTIVEIGGQDSKLIFMNRDRTTGDPVILDHALNDVCAAGTGSFLDLQAHRLGMAVKDLGPLALQAEHPARLSGRCSVFAKSDMVHLLQEGTPKADIVAGLCDALALNFITNLGKGRPFDEPILFQGGVAANAGVIRAFERQLGLAAGQLIIPEHFSVMGAIGSAVMARHTQPTRPRALSRLIHDVRQALSTTRRNRSAPTRLAPLVCRNGSKESIDRYYDIPADTGEVYLGVDVGAVSTNIVMIDSRGELRAKQYWYTRAEAIDTVRQGLAEMGDKAGPHVRVCGVGVTGSGRYFIGDFVGADVVINEISAQARAAVHVEPGVDTIIEIGGQDSKYIRCRDGQVVDFEMNKVCAAGTGSFLEEQAARLDISIQKGFSRLAFSSRSPVNLGPRCTVFMESDLVHHLQTGKTVKDLAAGLAYAIALNYREKVAGNKTFGSPVLFQGGVAGNQSVAAAFENLLNTAVAIPEHHNVMGAMGAALAARDRKPAASRFAGFYLQDRPYELKTFECGGCPNRCNVHKIYIEDKLTSYHGGLCGRYEKGADLKKSGGQGTDLFAERMDRLLEGLIDRDQAPEKDRRPTVGMARSLTFFDRFAFWAAFFKTLGHPVILSDETNNDLVSRGMVHVPSETCFPVKALYGHIVNLISKGVSHILLPTEIDHPGDQKGPRTGAYRTFNCPYVQSAAYMVKSAFGTQVPILSPIVHWSRSRPEVDRSLERLARSLGHSAAEARNAIQAAWTAQQDFEKWRRRRGKAFLETLKGDAGQALVLLGKTHNIFDPGLNLHLIRKLERLGQTVVPFDMLPLEQTALPQHYDNVVWKNTRDLLAALAWIKQRPSFFPVVLTNFGCGPDSFFLKYMETELNGIPHLVLEVDDHTGDAGLVTRIEAFLETLQHAGNNRKSTPCISNLTIRAKDRIADPWAPQPAIMRRLENKSLYFPFVSKAFSQIVRAAFKHIGLEARMLPEPDDEVEYLGRQVTSGRECHPFIVTSGAFVKLTREPGFDPDRSAVLMLNYDGACRFSQYAIGHADLFKRLGLPQVPVIAPLTSPRFEEFSGLFGLRFTRALWQGWLAAEVLDRIRLHTRPYETRPGHTDRVYAEGIKKIAQAVTRRDGGSSPGGGTVLAALKTAAGALAKIPVDRSEVRPRVGCVGEFYTVLNRRANQDLVRTLEALGAEVTLHGLTVPNFFSLFSQHYYSKDRLKKGRPVSAAYYWLRNQWMVSWIRRAQGCLPPTLRPFGNLDARTVVRECEPYIHYDIDPVLATFTARVRRFAAMGVSGICNLFVLNCMLGNVSIPVFKHALRAWQGLPVLHAVYDGQQQTNMVTRIEAFMHQVKQYHLKHHRP